MKLHSTQLIGVVIFSNIYHPLPSRNCRVFALRTWWMKRQTDLIIFSLAHFLSMLATCEVQSPSSVCTIIFLIRYEAEGNVTRIIWGNWNLNFSQSFYDVRLKITHLRPIAFLPWLFPSTLFPLFFLFTLFPSSPPYALIPPLFIFPRSLTLPVLRSLVHCQHPPSLSPFSLRSISSPLFSVHLLIPPPNKNPN